MKDPIDKSRNLLINRKDIGGAKVAATVEADEDTLKREEGDSLGDLAKNGGGNTPLHHHNVAGIVAPPSETLAVAGSLTDSFKSSNSSLAKSESSDAPLSSSLRHHPQRAMSAQLKKVSISDVVSSPPPGKRDQTASPAAAAAGGGVLSHRASLIEVSSGRRARKVRFFINGDKFFKGAVIAVNNEKFRTFDKLLEHLTRIMVTQVTLPQGVRTIFSLDGRLVSDIDVIQNGESYVCSSTSNYKKLDYIALGD